jgi:hypothetical protein
MSAPEPPEDQMPDRLRVGSRHDGGELTGGVRDDGRIWVNAYNGAGVTVRVSAADAERFGRWLIRCARAGRGKNRPHLDVGPGGPESETEKP